MPKLAPIPTTASAFAAEIASTTSADARGSPCGTSSGTAPAARAVAMAADCGPPGTARLPGSVRARTSVSVSGSPRSGSAARTSSRSRSSSVPSGRSAPTSSRTRSTPSTSPRVARAGSSPASSWPGGAGGSPTSTTATVPSRPSSVRSPPSEMAPPTSSTGAASSMAAAAAVARAASSSAVASTTTGALVKNAWLLVSASSAGSVEPSTRTPSLGSAARATSPVSPEDGPSAFAVSAAQPPSATTAPSERTTGRATGTNRTFRVFTPPIIAYPARLADRGM
ncbi:hypothetical protein IU11_11525 [Cellulosimicrobium sp. MM]|nr:hypothetical protein IU11_11525 [Cellulosimicrobium sp. MM]